MRPRHQTDARSYAAAASSSLLNFPRSATTCKAQRLYAAVQSTPGMMKGHGLHRASQQGQAPRGWLSEISICVNVALVSAKRQ